MRRLLGMLRSDGERLPLAPNPGLDQLPRLVEQVRASGLEVDVSVERRAAAVAARRRSRRLPDRAGGARRTRSSTPAGRPRPWPSATRRSAIALAVVDNGSGAGANGGRRPRAAGDARARHRLRRHAGDRRRGCRRRLPRPRRAARAAERHRVITVVVADDQGMIRAGLRSLLQARPRDQGRRRGRRRAGRPIEQVAPPAPRRGSHGHPHARARRARRHAPPDRRAARPACAGR